MPYDRKLPSREAVALWAGFTAFVLAGAFVAVFPTYVPIAGAGLGVPVLGAILLVAIVVTVRRDAAHPLILAAAIPVFAIAAVDVLKGCPGVACPTPPTYDPWRNLRFFAEWSLLGPAVGVSSEPSQCATACPHEVEFLPMAVGYAATWYGFDGR